MAGVVICYAGCFPQSRKTGRWKGAGHVDQRKSREGTL